MAVGDAKGRETEKATYIPLDCTKIRLGNIVIALAMSTKIQDTVISTGRRGLSTQMVDIVCKALPLRMLTSRIKLLISLVYSIYQPIILLRLKNG